MYGWNKYGNISRLRKKKELLPEIYTIFSSSLTQRTGERSVRFAMEQNTQKHLVLYVYA